MEELSGNSENAMPVGSTNEYKGHLGSLLLGVKIAAEDAETAFATERNNFDIP